MLCHHSSRPDNARTQSPHIYIIFQYITLHTRSLAPHTHASAYRYTRLALPHLAPAAAGRRRALCCEIKCVFLALVLTAMINGHYDEKYIIYETEKEKQPLCIIFISRIMNAFMPISWSPEYARA